MYLFAYLSLMIVNRVWFMYDAFMNLATSLIIRKSGFVANVGNVVNDRYKTSSN